VQWYGRTSTSPTQTADNRIDTTSDALPHVASGDIEEALAPEIEVVQPSYLYIHTPLCTARCFNVDAFAKDRKHNKDVNPDLQTLKEQLLVSSLSGVW